MATKQNTLEPQEPAEAPAGEEEPLGLSAAGLGLAGKLLLIQQSIGQVPADGQMQGGRRYRYVKAGDVLNPVREAMNEAHVLLFTEVLSAQTHFDTMYNDKTGHLTELVLRFEWVDADNPEDRQSCLWFAQGADDQDKGASKAITAAEKSYLLKTFHITTEEDASGGGGGQPGAGGNGGGGGGYRGEPKTAFGKFLGAMDELGYDLKDAIKMAEALGLKGRVKDMSGPELSQIYAAARAQRQAEQEEQGNGETPPGVDMFGD